MDLRHRLGYLSYDALLELALSGCETDRATFDCKWQDAGRADGWQRDCHGRWSSCGHALADAAKASGADVRPAPALLVGSDEAVAKLSKDLGVFGDSVPCRAGCVCRPCARVKKPFELWGSAVPVW